MASAQGTRIWACGAYARRGGEIYIYQLLFVPDGKKCLSGKVEVGGGRGAQKIKNEGRKEKLAKKKKKFSFLFGSTFREASKPTLSSLEPEISQGRIPDTEKQDVLGFILILILKGLFFCSVPNESQRKPPTLTCI